MPRTFASRVIEVGMRWPEEVERNVTAIAGWTPPVDVANLPRWTFEVYKHLAGG